jgi:lysophospholipase L1-like esterase
VKRLALAAVILTSQFVLLEAAIRWHGGSEVAPAFQALFTRDPEIGHRLQPGASARFTTVEFSTDLRINAQGVRDDEDIGPKAPGERRIVVLGDSLVLSVQVPLVQTFCERLEARLNAAASGVRWRVINAGVQGYGPVQEWFFFDRVAAAFEPDVVLVVVFVGNDAIEAHDTRAWLDAGRPLSSAQPAIGRLREILRSSVVLQIVRLRWDLLRSKLATAAPERPLASYLAEPPPEVMSGVAVTRQAIEKIDGRARAVGARTGIVLMPARFQTDDADHRALSATVARAGGELVRDAATERLRDGLAPLELPTLDLLPVLARQPDRTGLFFQRNVHLTPRGHDVVAGALLQFLQDAAFVER